jgi:hypothetical protein
MGSVLDAHDHFRWPHGDVYNVLLLRELHNELLLIMPRKPSEASQSAAKPKGKGKVATSPENAQKPAKKKMGAPKGSGSKYTEEIADRICDLVSNGVNLRRVCRMEGMPAWRTVYDWVVARPDFAARLARAREMGFDALAEEALEISNTPVMGQKQVMGDKSTFTTVEDMLGHRRLQIETRLKLLAVWDPKRYGNKVQVGGDAENPIKIEAEVQAENLLSAVLKNVELKKQVDD